MRRRCATAKCNELMSANLFLICSRGGGERRRNEREASIIVRLYRNWDNYFPLKAVIFFALSGDYFSISTFSRRSPRRRDDHDDFQVQRNGSNAAHSERRKCDSNCADKCVFSLTHFSACPRSRRAGRVRFRFGVGQHRTHYVHDANHTE